MKTSKSNQQRRAMFAFKACRELIRGRGDSGSLQRAIDLGRIAVGVQPLPHEKETPAVTNTRCMKEWEFRQLRGDDGIGYISADGIDILHTGAAEFTAEENLAIAAVALSAPDMLDALRGLLAHAEAAGDAQGIDHRHCDSTCPLNIARAAIAKAGAR